MKIHAVGAKLFQEDRQTDRQTDGQKPDRHDEVNSLFLCNFTKAPEIRCILLVRMISVTTEVACPHATFSSTL